MNPIRVFTPWLVLLAFIPCARVSAARYEIKAVSLQFRSQHPFQVATVPLDSVSGSLKYDLADPFGADRELTLTLPGSVMFRRNPFLGVLLRPFTEPENPTPDWEFVSSRFETTRTRRITETPTEAEWVVRGHLTIGKQKSDQRVSMECNLSDVLVCTVSTVWDMNRFSVPMARFLGIRGKGICTLDGELSFAPEGGGG